MNIQLASAPVSWGILEFAGHSAGLRWDTVLSEMELAGYAGTELGPYGFLPSEPLALQAALREYQLTLLSAFVPVRLADREAHAAGLRLARQPAELLAACGCKHIVLSDDNCADARRRDCAGRISASDGLDDAGWQALADGVNEVARVMAADYGLHTVFHHHCGGYVETPAEVARLLEMTDPALVGLCLDTGHYLYGGGDPVDCVRRHAGRVDYVHLKDADPNLMAAARAGGWDYFRAVSAGLFCELGQGAVDFPGLLRALDEQGYDGWAVVEQDVMGGAGSPLDSARRNREYLRGLGL